MQLQHLCFVIGATAYRKASFDPSIPSLSGYNLHLSGFTCSGTESRLISCGHISGGRYYHNNDAGIKCCEYSQLFVGVIEQYSIPLFTSRKVIGGKIV